MTLDLDRLTSMIESGDVDTVICAVPDLWGRLVGKRVTGESFLKTALGSEGIHGSTYLFVVDMDMDPRPGYGLSTWENGFPDFRFQPDLGTIRLVPWWPLTALVLCDAIDEQTGDLLEIAPRTILKRQMARLADRGLTAAMASELEFYLFGESYRDLWARGIRDPRGASYYRGDYHILQSSRDESVIGEIRKNMLGAGIGIEFSKSEWGLGQQEINLRYAEVLEMADQHSIYKHGVKEIAELRGNAATFMAKPFIDDIGSSCHIHCSLWDAESGAPISASASGVDGMSPVFRQAIAGLCSTARELTWLSAPTVNSYKRFLPDSFAPTSVNWGLDNRTCGFRVVGHDSSLRVENRIPGADANPYLAFSAMIMGVIAGVDGELDCGPAYAGNTYEDPQIARVPSSLHAAIDLFASSSVAQDALGAEVFGHLLNFANQEQRAFESETVTDWERVRYFERI